MTTRATILWRILGRTKRVGELRAILISFIFPEFRDILGDLEELGAIEDKEPTP